MFQLYKNRNFSEYINDTFQFFKLEGKHFFKCYFIINIPLLLTLAALIYFVVRFYLDFLFSGATTGSPLQANQLANTFSEHAVGMSIFIFVFVLLILFISLIQFAYPVIYLDLYDKNKGANFTVKTVIDELKRKAFKLFKFCLGCLFIIGPISAIILVLLVLLCIVLIGIPLLFIVTPALTSWINISFYRYLSTDDHFLSSLTTSLDYVKQKFWPVIGSTVVVYLIIQITMSVFSLIPSLFGVASIFSPNLSQSENDAFSSITILTTVIGVISTIVGYIINNLLLINQGVIYYGQREANENTFSKSTIDLIGTDSE